MLADECSASVGWFAGRSSRGQPWLLRSHHRRLDSGVLEPGGPGPHPGESVHVRSFFARDQRHGRSRPDRWDDRAAGGNNQLPIGIRAWPRTALRLAARTHELPRGGRRHSATIRPGACRLHAVFAEAQFRPGIWWRATHALSLGERRLAPARLGVGNCHRSDGFTEGWCRAGAAVQLWPYGLRRGLDSCQPIGNRGGEPRSGSALRPGDAGNTGAVLFRDRRHPLSPGRLGGGPGLHQRAPGDRWGSQACHATEPGHSP